MKINGSKDLYDRVVGWMADRDDPSNLIDDAGADLDALDEYMLDAAMQIMRDIHQTCEDYEECKRHEEEDRNQ